MNRNGILIVLTALAILAFANSSVMAQKIVNPPFPDLLGAWQGDTQSDDPTRRHPGGVPATLSVTWEDLIGGSFGGTMKAYSANGPIDARITYTGPALRGLSDWHVDIAFGSGSRCWKLSGSYSKSWLTGSKSWYIHMAGSYEVWDRTVPQAPRLVDQGNFHLDKP